VAAEFARVIALYRRLKEQGCRPWQFGQTSIGGTFLISADGERRFVKDYTPRAVHISMICTARSSCPLLNQLEAIRAIALSLPADMALVVKEHPGMVGKRRIGYYPQVAGHSEGSPSCFGDERSPMGVEREPLDGPEQLRRTRGGHYANAGPFVRSMRVRVVAAGDGARRR
jgi:hypothetical protein